ncbi:MAG: tRNA 2-thiouridine(34) synthase MnmA [Ruminococcaceae bacterium]|nr:tRNA 2-thiouridine(34) synthase MnmA [Oscillospiraceae bacterium]
MRVLLALSGGVDSSACIPLLQQAGYDVSACVIAFSPAHAGAVAAAQQVAQQAGIPLTVVHREDAFDALVVQPFCREYAAGRTPNPCPMCNPLVKFRALADEADRLGIDAIASGHYAQVREVDGTFYVAQAASAARDQSYMLYRLPQDILRRLLLPAGALEKADIRAVAAQSGFASANAPDSQEICFVPNGNYAGFIERRGVQGLPGRFIGPGGEDLGPHRGVLHYTVGQRRGIGLALGKPVFVKSILPGGDIRLAWGDGLYAAGVVLEDMLTTAGAPLPPGPYTVKIRSMAKPAPCMLSYHDAGLPTLLFDTPQRAPAPGQHAVLYQNDLVVGGGVIRTVLETIDN